VLRLVGTAPDPLHAIDELTIHASTHVQSSRPAAPSSPTSPSCSRSNTPARAHSENRRQQLVTEAQPNSATGSSAHGVDVRAMKMIAAMQARSEIGAGRATAGVGGRGWQQRLDALPERLGQQPIGQGGHGQAGYPAQHRVADPTRRPHHLVMNQPREILTGGQVTLRRWRAADADTVYQVVLQSLEHLLPWMPWASGYGHDDAARFTPERAGLGVWGRLSVRDHHQRCGHRQLWAHAPDRPRRVGDRLLAAPRLHLEGGARSGAGWVGGAGTRAVGAGGWSRGHSVAVPATSATSATAAAAAPASRAGEPRRMVSFSRAWLDCRPSGPTGGRTARCRAGRQCRAAAFGW
jgi:hypothetical protein